MSNDEIQCYIVTITGGDKSLTELNELTNSLTTGGFTLTLTDKEGKIHDLGPLTFSLTTTLAQDEVKALALGLAQSVLSDPPQVEIATVDEWIKSSARDPASG